VLSELLEGVGIAKAFPFKVNRIYFPPAKPEIPVVAENALKHLLFEKFKGGVVKFHGGEDAIGVDPRLKAGVDAVQIQEFHPLIHLQHVGVIDDIQAVGLMEGSGKFGEKAVG
jgi:hypothetical protein